MVYGFGVAAARHCGQWGRVIPEENVKLEKPRPDASKTNLDRREDFSSTLLACSDRNSTYLTNTTLGEFRNSIQKFFLKQTWLLLSKVSRCQWFFREIEVWLTSLKSDDMAMHFHDMRWLEDIIYIYIYYIYISWSLCQLSCRCAWLLRGSLIICVVTVPNISHNYLYMVLYYPQMYVCVHTLVVMLPHVPVGMDACWKWNHRFQVCHGKVSIVQKASLYCTFLSMSVCLVFSKNTKTYGLSMSTFFNSFRSQIPRQSTGSWGFQCIESPNTKMPLLNHWWYPLSLALSANIGWTFVIIGNLNTEVKLPSICQTGGGVDLGF